MEPHRRLPLPLLERPPPGPFRREFWRSPLRGPWLASLLGWALLPLVLTAAVTGFLSHAAYDPDLGRNHPGGPSGSFDLYFFDWPSSPAWLYALTQGLHVISGIAAIPLLLAKLWSVIPKLFEWPPARSIAHALERLSLTFLVGGSLFVLFTGVLNIQLYYPWKFNFLSSHYYGAFVFLAALALHVGVKVRLSLRTFRRLGVLSPLRADLARTRAEFAAAETSAPSHPAPPTMSRRGLIGLVGAGSAGLGLITAGQVVGGPLRRLAVLAPHGPTAGDGPNDFQVNKTAASVGIEPEQTGALWVLELEGPTRVSLSRDELLAMPQATERLPIACVEGWTTTQEWTGVRLGDLARRAGVVEAGPLRVKSLQEKGIFSQATLNAGQVANPRSLLALKVNGVDLSLDHGFPARVIVPALPGVHCTKWVARMTFSEA